MALIDIRDLTFAYPGSYDNVFEHLSLQLDTHWRLGLVGRNGRGKTTLLRCIAGLETPDSGQITDLPERIAYVFQEDRLCDGFSAVDNIRLVTGKALGEGEIRRHLEELGLAGSLDQPVRELSGGMRQRAAFARTMLTGCDLLLLDEPFSALDFLTRISMQEWLLDQWQRHKRTILFITHDVEEALFLSSSVLVVERTPIRELAEIPVPASFPRDRSCLKLPEMVELKEHLIDLLRKQVTP